MAGFSIIDWEQDEAGFWRIRVQIAGNTVMFKFADWPDDETVQAEAVRYVAMMTGGGEDAPSESE